MKNKLLIAGDSFAADWSKKYNGVSGWVNMLESDYDVTNIAEAGVSEYKIYKQLEKIDITKFDHVIVSHTSAYRIPIVEHPIHKNDLLHNNCDIIYSDAEEHIENDIMKIAIDFYGNIFHSEYFCFINDLIFKEIQKITPNAFHITFFDNFYDSSVLKFEDIFLSHKGNVNHLDEKGNSLFYNMIKNILNEKEIISK
jgi:hypothetical protein